jgi:hypothetical protein
VLGDRPLFGDGPIYPKLVQAYMLKINEMNVNFLEINDNLKKG